ncbi:MAG: imidazoleglycerol-phosphate dehydratase [Candidatus Methanomethylophilaceae archaeon]|nr:imidazoleglycerol-phosphate dehydratase [Candidatus Methanomethylophilaceae archaeon]
MTGRTAKIDRRTRETQISVELDVDGTGRFEVESNIMFLRHMVETLARYASFDLKVSAYGDNDHHIIEDTAITIGKALQQALDGRPVERMATAIVPMDDALVMTSLDLVDRPYADIDCPSPEYHHFFRSFAMSAGLTLHVVVMRGFDEHHIIEAGFKSMGKALKEAVRPRGEELSTKDAVRIGGSSRCSRRG